ncbi:MAG: hypothetical protein AAF512_10410, partial [Pseudomonadota bacterium]
TYTELCELTEDNPDWWDFDADPIEGFTDTDQLKEIIVKNRRRRRSDVARQVLKGAIEEDMVFLQRFTSRNISRIIKPFQEAETFADLSGLIGARGSRWLNFTQPSRRMASSIYQAVMGKQGGR